jgi:branched-subunit amino acid ABC-type transport system permease component
VAAVVSTLVPAIGFGLVTASILAVAGVGFTLQFGVTNILNLAYGDIMTASAFVAYLVTSAGASVWLALVAGAAFGGVFSVLLNRALYTPFVRRGTRLFGMIIVTISVSLIVQNGLQAIFGASFFSLKMARPSPVHIAGMVFTTVQLAIIGIAIAAMLLIHH